MPEISASIEYLQKLDLYQKEKPYYCLLAPHNGFDPDAQRLNNLEFEQRPDITVTDIRNLNHSWTENGFQVLQHRSEALPLDSSEQSAKYVAETEELLRQETGAIFVKCYEIRQRHNVRIDREQMDYNNLLLVEGPAKGAHNGN
jgi:hypothetical protein